MAQPSRWDAIVDGSLPIPANDNLGFRIEGTDDPAERVTFSWTVPSEYTNSAGGLQGGMLAAFADALLGGASAAYLPPERYPALAEMKISIFRPVPAGMTLKGAGYVVKSGRRVIFAEAEISDEDGNLIAKASGTEIPADMP
ncbi:MAG: PaaI family thioesterase [Actinomycetota bacterium]|nr:PaaI family thioesterase [Actinomycetota bacterium]